MNVGYQGIPGSYSEMATVSFFQDRPIKEVNYIDFHSLISALERDEIDYAVIPVENSTTGLIYRSMDILRYSSCFAIGELYLKIEHKLIGFSDVSIDEIEKVYSHPEAISQCQNFLSKYPKIIPVAYYDTAKSVSFVKESKDKKLAALGNSRAAEIYNLSILKENVQNTSMNTTRFLIFKNSKIDKEISSEISKEISSEIIIDSDKATLYFETGHVPGSLLKILDLFYRRNINLLSLTSRPVQGEDIFKYGFFIDIDISSEYQTLKEVLEQMKEFSFLIKVLGTYKSAKI